jgi:hypothetical protein
MLFFRPSIAKVFDKPRAPSFAEIQKNRQLGYLKKKSVELLHIDDLVLILNMHEICTSGR